jgi:hypothetical protein
LREASLRLRAHDGVGAGDDYRRFLRQEIETESEKHKKNPKSPKTKNKSIKEMKK